MILILCMFKNSLPFGESLSNLMGRVINKYIRGTIQIRFIFNSSYFKYKLISNEPNFNMGS